MSIFSAALNLAKAERILGLLRIAEDQSLRPMKSWHFSDFILCPWRRLSFVAFLGALYSLGKQRIGQC